MLSYLINSLLFFVAFWLLYRLCFRRETFFKVNRIYLLALPALSLLLPLFQLNFLKFEEVSESVPKVLTTYLSPIQITDRLPSSVAVAPETTWTWFQLAAIIYVIGMLTALGIFLFKLFKLLILKKRAQFTVEQGQKIYRLPHSNQAFSFFRYVFIGDQLAADERRSIIMHESAHVAGKHSWDLLYCETLRILLWFNPIVYVLQRDLVEVHEFLADRKTTRTYAKKSYIESLMNAHFGTHQFSFTSSFFNQNPLKNRIMMLYKVQSSSKAKLKYLLILPLAFLMLTYVSCSEEGNIDATRENSKTQTTNTLKSTPPAPPAPPSVIKVPFRAIDVAPEFLNSPSFSDNEAARQYFEKRIHELVAEEFNIGLTQTLPDTIKAARIYTVFEIDSTGKVVNIRARARNEALKNEAIRVVKKFPRFKPGEHKGTPVRTVYNLPIVLKNGD